MKLYKQLILLTLGLSLFGCSEISSDKYIVDAIAESLEEEVVLDKMVKIGYKDKKIIIYKSDYNEVNVYVFHNKEIVQMDTINLDVLTEKELYWVYGKGEGYYYLVGGVSKSVKPDIKVNNGNFTGNIISLNDANIFFSFYDSPLSMPVDVTLNKD